MIDRPLRLSPEQLGALAGKLSTGLRIYLEATQNSAPRVHRPAVPGRACLDFRGHLR